jgi:hypothetical protein
MFTEQLPVPGPTVLVMAAFSNSSCEAARKDGNMGWVRMNNSMLFCVSSTALCSAYLAKHDMWLTFLCKCTQTFASTSGTPFVPFVSSLWEANAIPEHLFSTLLTMNTTGSALTVGGVDKSNMDESTLVSYLLIVWTDMWLDDGHLFSADSLLL